MYGRVARGLNIDDEPRDFSPKIALSYLSNSDKQFGKEGDKMIDPTLDPFLTTSYFPLKLPSRLILCILKIELAFSSTW